MGRSQESFNKKEVRNKKEKKRKEKEKKRLEKKDNDKSSFEDMIAYVDHNGMIVDTPPDPALKKSTIKAENIEISIPRRDASDVMDVVRKGIVNFFDETKGFGFIKDSETSESVFVHANNLLEPIKENNLVSFEVEMGQKGPMATKVKVVR